jgi:hypothetical protein
MLAIRQQSALTARISRMQLTASRGLATHASLAVKDCASITPPYPRLLQTLDKVRNVLGSGTKLTLAEKILYSHLRNPEESLGGGGKVRGERYLKLRPDRVAMQVSVPADHVAKHAIDWFRMLRRKWLCYNS